MAASNDDNVEPSTDAEHTLLYSSAATATATAAAAPNGHSSRIEGSACFQACLPFISPSSPSVAHSLVSFHRLHRTGPNVIGSKIFPLSRRIHTCISRLGSMELLLPDRTPESTHSPYCVCQMPNARDRFSPREVRKRETRHRKACCRSSSSSTLPELAGKL